MQGLLPIFTRHRIPTAGIALVINLDLALWLPGMMLSR